MKSIVLPEFQEYLRSKSPVNEKYIQFYSHWASKFVVFSISNGNLSHDLRGRRSISAGQVERTGGVLIVESLMHNKGPASASAFA